MELTLECELEHDGRWLAEVPQLSGVLAYGRSRDEAMARAQAMALRILAARFERGHTPQAIRMMLALP